MGERPAWCDGYEVKFSVPDKIWITSNYTDSDLKARQHGQRKATTWGRGNTLGVREKVGSQLIAYAEECWKRQPYCGYSKYIVIASIAYPYGVAQADPGQYRRKRERDSESGNERRRMAWHHVELLQGRGVRPV